MLFDLKGKRRRTVQVTYVALAFLMAVGLIGAGVGSGVSGGIFDLFSGGGGSSTANKAVEKRIKTLNAQLRVNPKNQAALAALTRAHYNLASVTVSRKTNAFDAEGKKELAQADSAWQRYLDTDPKKPDASLAGVMLVAYSKLGLNQPQKAADTAEIIASAASKAEKPQAYLRLTACATVAGQTRKATLAAQKVLDSVPKDQKKAAQDSVKQAKAPQTAAQLCS